MDELIFSVDKIISNYFRTLDSKKESTRKIFRKLIKKLDC